MGVYSEDAYRDISWCIWHEGVWPYTAHYLDGQWVDIPCNVPAVRKRFLVKQDHNSGARGLINSLSDAELLEVIEACEVRIPIEKELDSHFRWVCKHENMEEQFRVNFNNGEYSLISQSYGYLQSHNPNAKNLLCCFKYTNMIEYFRRMLS